MTKISLAILLIFFWADMAYGEDQLHCESVLDILGDDIPEIPTDVSVPSSRADTISMYVELSIVRDDFSEVYFERDGIIVHANIGRRGVIADFGFVDDHDLSSKLCATFPGEANLESGITSSIRVRNPELLNRRFIFSSAIKFVFRNQGGSHMIGQVEDGLVDTRWRLVDMTPLPKFFAKRIFKSNKFVRIVSLPQHTSDGDEHLDTELVVFGTSGTGETYEFGDQRVFRVSDLIELGVEKLVVETGPYYLEAIPATEDLADAVRDIRYVSPREQHPGLDRIEGVIRDMARENE